jgi:hypothetical protein
MAAVSACMHACMQVLACLACTLAPSHPGSNALHACSPGSLDTFANFSCSVSRFMSEDLPTLERPISANSGKRSGGQSLTAGLLLMKTALFTRACTGGGSCRSKWTNALALEPAGGGVPETAEGLEEAARSLAVCTTVSLKLLRCSPLSAAGAPCRRRSEEETNIGASLEQQEVEVRRSERACAPMTHCYQVLLPD